MSTSMATASLADTLPSTVPKLDNNGLNWAIFRVRFQDAVEAKGFWGHFDGTTPCPVLPPTVTAPDGTIISSASADEVAAHAQWEKNE